MFFLNKKIFLLVTCLALGTQSYAQEAKKEHVSSTASIPAVDVFNVTQAKNEAITLYYPGKTQSAQSVTIKARTNGILLKKYFNEGDFVKQGDLLYVIEPQSYEAAYNQAKANAASANVQMQKTKKEWERINALFESGASSDQEKDNAYWAYESAQAALAGANAALQTATINLDRTSVKATISGMTGLKQVDVGALVADGTPLVEITQVSPIHVEFSLPDIDVMKQKYAIQNGRWSKPAEGKLKAALSINDIPLKEIGTVDFIDSTLNAKTGSLKARAVFKNEHQELLPNQFVKVALKGLVRHDVIKIPQKAVLQNPLGASVYVVEEGKAVQRTVKVGEASENDYVIESGLKAGDQVILNNFFKIKNQTPVKIDKVLTKEAK
jgi:membrane fusion protein (multidrug efflux system)